MLQIKNDPFFQQFGIRSISKLNIKDKFEIVAQILDTYPFSVYSVWPNALTINENINLNPIQHGFMKTRQSGSNTLSVAWRASVKARKKNQKKNNHCNLHKTKQIFSPQRLTPQLHMFVDNQKDEDLSEFESTREYDNEQEIASGEDSDSVF